MVVEAREVGAINQQSKESVVKRYLQDGSQDGGNGNGDGDGDTASKRGAPSGDSPTNQD